MLFDDREIAFRPRLTDEFLATLIEAARIVGWGVDLVEVHSFIRELHTIAGREMPPDEELIPYELTAQADCIHPKDATQWITRDNKVWTRCSLCGAQSIRVKV